MFRVPNKFRIRVNHALASDDAIGNNGAFKIKLNEKATAYCIASDQNGWEHVSVHVVEDGTPEIPTWEEMCAIKNLFWEEDDTVVQYHPAQSEYVNTNPNVLHLWRPTNAVLPTPPKIMV